MACPLNSISGTPNPLTPQKRLVGARCAEFRLGLERATFVGRSIMPIIIFVRILYISGAAATVSLGVADATLTAATNEGVCRYVGRYDRRRQTWIIVARYARKGRSGLKRPDGLATCPSECRQNHARIGKRMRRNARVNILISTKLGFDLIGQFSSCDVSSNSMAGASRGLRRVARCSLG